jgi:DNA-binding HxlR family transcriptional regulator
MLGLSSPIRVSIMKFLLRARKNGEAEQSFTNIKHALESTNPYISTSDLDYHLKELKKVKFINHLNAGEKNAVYLLTELGEKLVEVYFTIEGMHDESQILSPNNLDTHVYKNQVLKLVEPCKNEPHVTKIAIEPRRSEKAVDTFLTEHLDDASKKRPVKRKPTMYSGLDSFR